jgi:hypothetical protein
VRRPPWAERLTVEYGGETLTGREEGEYLILDRPWHTGDEILLRYSLKTRVLNASDVPEYQAVYCGPWLLGISESDSAFYFEEGFVDNQLALDENLKQPESATARESSLRIPFAHRAVSIRSNGYPDYPATVTLRPFSERTASAGGMRWEYKFRPNAGGDFRGSPKESTRGAEKESRLSFNAMIGIGIAAMLGLLVLIERIVSRKRSKNTQV